MDNSFVVMIVSLLSQVISERLIVQIFKEAPERSMHTLMVYDLCFFNVSFCDGTFAS